MISIKLQNIVFQYDADANFRTYTQLMHKGDDLAYDPEAKCHILKKYDRVNFTSYFNCLQIRRWKEQTYAKRFTLRLELQGKAFVELETVYRNSKSINYGVLSQDATNPMLNRATSQLYPPGSTFKTVVAAAAAYLAIRNGR